MSKIVRLRDNTTFYVTDKQAEDIFREVNNNPKLRIMRVITGQGYRYINAVDITSMLPGWGEDYKSNAELEQEHQQALKVADKQLAGGSNAGLIGE